MTDLVVYSNAIGAIAFAILCLALFSGQIASAVGRTLLLASFCSALWLGVNAYYYANTEAVIFDIRLTQVFEIARYVAWFGFLGVVLLSLHKASYRKLVATLLAICAIVAIGAIITTFSPRNFTIARMDSGDNLGLMMFLTLPILGLLLLEQLYRNTHTDARWGIKHLCLGLAAVFLFDIYLYAEGVLFRRINVDAWTARGLVNAIVVPFIGISAKRNTEWGVNLFVSRQVLFQTTALVAVGLYLIFMALAGYYLKTYGGTWGGALRVAVSFAGLLALVTLIVSSQARSRLRLFLAKHFYPTKYEYGDVWLSLTEKLSHHQGDAKTLHEVTLKSIADILDSTGGMLWYKDQDGNFVLGAEWVLNGDVPERIPAESPLIQVLAADNEVIDLNVAATSMTTDTNQIPGYIFDLQRAWLLIPVFHDQELLAFLILAESRSNEGLTEEDRELLRTVSRQAGSYIALLRSTDALSELRQFEAFNQMSAFLVHDLKNVIAQLSLIVKNAERYRDNPEFISDSFTTVNDAVTKMNRMLANLKSETVPKKLGTRTTLDVVQLIENTVDRCRDRQPVPTIKTRLARACR